MCKIFVLLTFQYSYHPNNRIIIKINDTFVALAKFSALFISLNIGFIVISFASLN